MHRLTQKYMTKHTDIAGIEFLLKGSVKIGTLAGYKHAEGQKMLSADLEEGSLDIQVRDPPGAYVFSSPALGIKNAIAINCRHGVRYTEHFDAWIFCASYGPYDAQRHSAILNGCEDYSGCKDYTEYAIIDVAEFCDALVEAVSHKLRCDSWVGVNRVKFRDVQRNVSLEDFESAVSSPNLQDEILHRIFEKPNYYKVEDEIRVLIEADWKSPNEWLSPLFVQSDKLAKSIKEVGRWL